MFDGILGGLVSGALGFLGQEEANETNIEIANNASAASAEQAKLNREFQERMSSTAHQREVADLKKAGLNPMLSGLGGAGSSTPGGATGQAFSTTVGNKVAAATANAIGAQSLAQTNAQIKNIEADTKLKGAQQVKELSSAGQLGAQTSSILQEMRSFDARLEKLGWEARGAQFEAGIKNSEDYIRARMKDLDVGRHEVERMMYQAQKYKEEARLLGLEVPEMVARAAYWASDIGKARPYTEHGGEVLRDATSAFRLRRFSR